LAEKHTLPFSDCCLLYGLVYDIDDCDSVSDGGSLQHSTRINKNNESSRTYFAEMAKFVNRRFCRM